MKYICLTLIFLLYLPVAHAQAVTGAGKGGNPVPDLIARSKRAVVALAFLVSTKPPDEDTPSYALDYPPGQTLYAIIAGTGFVVSQDGLIVTADHVVAKAPNLVFALFPDSEIKSGQVVPSIGHCAVVSTKVMSRSEEEDYAVYKTETHDLPFLRFGKFADVREGEDLIFIGYPFGVLAAVTHRGMVSWKGTFKFDDIPRELQVAQLNAIVNNGNSGGPLIDLNRGQVVGIIRAKFGRLSRYLQTIKDGKIVWGGNFGGGGFDFVRFVKDTVDVVDRDIQMGVGYAVSSEYAEQGLKSLAKSTP